MPSATLPFPLANTAALAGDGNINNFAVAKFAATAESNALPYAEGPTISRPYVVALLPEAAELKPGDNVLEVGTGIGLSGGSDLKPALADTTVAAASLQKAG
jgi:predicted O-methyltransferase YrrM